MLKIFSNKKAVEILRNDVSDINNYLDSLERIFKQEVKYLKDENWKLIQRVAHLEQLNQSK